MIRGLENDTVMSFQINELLNTLEYIEERIQALEDKIKEQAEPYMREILISMKGIGIFTAIAVIADISHG